MSFKFYLHLSLLLYIKGIYHFKRNWPHFCLSKFCRISIYVITVAKFSNRLTSNLLNFLQQFSMDFCKVIRYYHFVIISLKSSFWWIMSITEKNLDFTAAVRCFYYNQNIWPPKEGEILICYHQRDIAFDVFAIKTKSKNGSIVRHLTRKVSWVPKSILNRGAKITATLTSTNFCRSPLV